MSVSSDSPPAPPGPPRRISRTAAVEALFQQGIGHQRAQRIEDAAMCYAAALALKPDDARIANNLAVAWRALGRRIAAEALYRRVLAAGGGTVALHVNHGNVLRDLGRLDAAEAAHRRALTLDPQARGALYGLGLVHRDQKRLDESVEALEQVVAMDPDDAEANWDLAQSLLCAGDYGRGFAQYEWRWRLPGVQRPPSNLPEWDGTPQAGRSLLLYGEQGFGDVIQFARFIPQAVTRGGPGCDVVLQVRPELIPLLAGQFPGVTRFIPRDSPVADCTVQAPLLSLPYLLGLERSDVPTAPYLAAPPRSLRLPPRPPEVKRLIGLCWQGSPTQKNDRNRSLPFEALLPLLARPDIAFVSLQKGPAASAPREHGMAGLFPPLDAMLTDFADTAAMIDRLDLVITADTSVLHVAAAMGKPVWVLLSVFHDWRFDATDSISTWYPTVTVFKQRTAGDWSEVVTRVEAALATELEEDVPA